MTNPEKEHIVEAAHFELGKVEDEAIRARMVEHFNHIDHDLAVRVACGIGVTPPSSPVGSNTGRRSPALSMERGSAASIATRKVAVLIAEGFDAEALKVMRKALEHDGARVELVSKFSGSISSASGDSFKVDKMYVTAGSIMYDAVYVPGGEASVDTLLQHGDARHFINEAFRHCKAICATDEGVELLMAADLKGVDLAGPESETVVSSLGVITARRLRRGLVDRVSDALGGDRHVEPASVAEQFIAAIARHRWWNRTMKDQTPA